MAVTQGNDLTIYDFVAVRWWSGQVRWLRVLRNMAPGRLRWFDRHIDWRGKRVLDLGCGGGFMAEAMQDRGALVTGIDPAAEAITAARIHAEAGGREIAYDVGAGENLPYADASFDAVVCVDVLEHVEDLQRVVDEVARVLRPGGVFLFDTINRTALSRFVTITLAERVLGVLPRGTHDPALFVRPGELKQAMKRAGLSPGAMVGLGPRGIDRRGDPVFGHLPLTSVIYMGVAGKAVAP